MTRFERSNWRSLGLTFLKWAAMVVALVFLVRELRGQWSEVRGQLEAMQVWVALSSVVMAMIAVTASAEQQRHLLSALGHTVGRREWFAVFYAAQLGKYVPGTAWAYVSQMELSRTKGIRRAESLAVMLIGAAMTVLVSFAFGIFSLPFATVAWLPFWMRLACAVFGFLGLAAIVLRPSLVTELLARLPGRLRIDRRVLGIRVRLGPSVMWTILASVMYGVHLFVLCFQSSSTDGLSLLTASIGGFSTAWVVGFLAIFVPAGVGVREVIIAGFMAPLLVNGAAALTAVVLSRFIIIVAEALLLCLVPILRLRRPVPVIEE